MNAPRRAAAALAACLAATWSPVLPGAASAVAQDAPPAEEQDPTPEAKRLLKESKSFFNTAGDTDLSRDERRDARKEAYTRLEKAQGLLDAWLEKHPGDAGRMDDLYGEIATMMFWLRKEAGVGELSGAKIPPPPPPPPPSPAEPGAPPAPGASAPAEPPKPAAPTVADALATIREYEKTHPGDVPGLHDRYTRLLSEHPDRETPEYEAAVKRLEELGQRLKQVYRLARDDDPDALQDVDAKEVVALVDQLAADLAKGDEPVRTRAARYLGGLGSGKAAPPLMEALRREAEGPVRDAVVEALSKIGGRRVCDRLAKEKPTSPLAPAVVEVLCRTVERGGVNARIAGEALAKFTAGCDDATQARATEVLFAAGKDGALGLSIAVDTAPVEKKVAYIEHLGEIGDSRTAGHLALFLTVNPEGARRAQQKAARDAIEKIGKPGVRYLIPMLDDKRCQVWTAEMLRTITGAKPADDKRKTWETWFRSHRRELEGR